MGMEWKEVLATDFCLEVTDGTHDSPKPKEEGHFLVTSKHLQGFDIDFTKAYKISEEDYQKVVSRSRVEQYDILFSMIGTIGNIHRVTIPIVDFAVKNVGIFKFGGDDLRSRWLYYWFKSPFANEYINSTLAGSTQSYLTLKSLRNFPIMVPKMEEMKRIVDILSSLDAKIENNNKINAKLEEMAQALFKSWFIDFEPFKVGRDGSRPAFGSGNFVESELGMIPEGWKVGILADLGDIVGGGTPSKSKPEYYTEKGIAWLTPKDLSISPNKFTSKGETDITEIGYKNSSAKLMPKGSVLFSSRAPIGYISIAKNDICTNQGFKSVVPNYAGTAYLYYLLKYLTPDIENKSTGSTFKEASGSLMKSLTVIIPPKQYLDDFELKVSAIFDKQEILEEENKNLSQTRDTLLPKLMSGEIEL